MCRLCQAVVPFQLGWFYYPELESSEVKGLCQEHLVAIVEYYRVEGECGERERTTPSAP